MNTFFNIGIITTSRSEFGVLKDLIFHISNLSKLTLFVGGSHLIDKSSYQEIKEFTDSLSINVINLNSNKFDNDLRPSNQMINIGKMGESLSVYLEDLKIDLLIIIGDRWELFSASISALLCRVPIAHISGGEITREAIDENIRHSITKMAHLHFVACEKYAENISCMGEEDWRIVISGEIGLDWIHNNPIIEFRKTISKLKIPFSEKFILFTYHPISYGDFNLLEKEVNEIKNAFKSLKDFTILITGPGYEIGSEYVRLEFENLAKNKQNIYYQEHLGRDNYLSLMNGALLVLGNSSSGIFEAPSLKITTINIGLRQNGRERANSTIDIKCDSNEIIKNVKKYSLKMSKEKKEKIINPYDPFMDGKNSLRVAKACINALSTKRRNKLLTKNFSKNIEKELWNKMLN